MIPLIYWIFERILALHYFSIIHTKQCTLTTQCSKICKKVQFGGSQNLFASYCAAYTNTQYVSQQRARVWHCINEHLQCNLFPYWEEMYHIHPSCVVTSSSKYNALCAYKKTQKIAYFGETSKLQIECPEK